RDELRTGAKPSSRNRPRAYDRSIRRRRDPLPPVVRHRELWLHRRAQLSEQVSAARPSWQRRLCADPHLREERYAAVLKLRVGGFDRELTRSVVSYRWSVVSGRRTCGIR